MIDISIIYHLHSLAWITRCRRDADDVVAGHSNRAFISPARGGSRPHASLMSPGTLPKSPPLFLASPDRRRGAGAGHVDRMTPGGMIDGPSLLANLASPAAIIRRPGSDLPEPGRQVGGVPPGFGTPKVRVHTRILITSFAFQHPRTTTAPG